MVKDKVEELINEFYHSNDTDIKQEKGLDIILNEAANNHGKNIVCSVVHLALLLKMGAKQIYLNWHLVDRYLYRIFYGNNDFVAESGIRINDFDKYERKRMD